jgi:nucleotide-binding universal stress UspA family protein
VHMLLCTDGSLTSEPAVAFGSRFAVLLQAQVTVLEAAVRPDREPGVSRPTTDLCASLAAAGLNCKTIIRSEIPRQAIVNHTVQEPYDLIVIGLLRRGNWLRRWLRGPSTRRVLQRVIAPVLVVPSDRPVLHRILLCSGDLWYPAETIQLVGQIAQATGAEVTLLYVIPQPLLHYPVLREIEDAWGSLLQTDTLQGRNLKAGRDTLRGLGVETGISLRHGPVVEQIMAEIREGEYDLVALGSTYAAQSLYRYFVRSITDLVVEQAGRPVLVVRHLGKLARQ